MKSSRKFIILLLPLCIAVISLVLFSTYQHSQKKDKLVHETDQIVTASSSDVTVTEPLPPPRPVDSAPSSPDTPVSDDGNMVACTMDAKQCPDGSYVGRIAPNCEFAACPTTEEQVCSPESRMAEMCAEIYAPVCGAVQVECVTTPCEPVRETFSNSCFACANERVQSYQNGACEADVQI